MSTSENKKKVVYFVRHGQSIDNASPVFQAYSSPLSEKGRKQAETIANRVSTLSFESLIASPVPRAKETAEAIAKATGNKPEFSELFVERVKPTAIDGTPWADKEATKIWRDWEKSLVTPGMRVLDGENFDDIVGRADEALAYLRDSSESSIVVVSHGHFIRTIVARALVGGDLTGPMLKRFYMLMSMENTAITVLKYSDAFEEEFCWRLWTHNDHAHFAE